MTPNPVLNADPKPGQGFGQAGGAGLTCIVSLAKPACHSAIRSGLRVAVSCLAT
jgi:hypothetical protein